MGNSNNVLVQAHLKQIYENLAAINFEVKKPKKKKPLTLSVTLDQEEEEL